MVDIIAWPFDILRPQRWPFNPVPFTRGGGPTLGGVSRTLKTDLGFWSGAYESIMLRRGNRVQERAWNALRGQLQGRSGLVAVPVPAGYKWIEPSFRDFAPYGLTFDDGSSFADGSTFVEGHVTLQIAADVAIGDVTMTLTRVNAPSDIVGGAFSYQHAYYEITKQISVSGSDWTVGVFPAARAAIPAGATVEADRPDCLCHLAADDAMDLDTPIRFGARPSVEFVEATDYWSDLAAGLIT